MYTIYPLLQCQSSSGSVGKSISPTEHSEDPSFKSWLDLSVFVFNDNLSFDNLSFDNLSFDNLSFDKITYRSITYH